MELSPVADSSQIIVYTLCNLADDYLSQAHSLSVDASNLHKYNLLVYSSIKIYSCILSRNMNIPTVTEISIYLRIAEIYYQETDNYEIMENYLNKAITISKRTNNLDLQFRAEFLQALILINDNYKVGLKYLNLKIENFKVLQLFHWIKVFEFLKILLLINNDVKLSLSLLNNFNLNNNGDNQFEIYCLLIHANLNLSLNNLSDCRLILDKLTRCFANETSTTNYEIKYFYSMFKLISLKYFIELKDYNKSKLLVNEINKFIEVNFKDWNSTFSILIPLPINLNKLTNFKFQIKWFSIEELQIILWLLCGILNLYNYHKSNKPYKYLLMSLRMLDAYNAKFVSQKGKSQNNNFGTCLNDLNLKIIKLKYLRFQILYYLSYYELLTENVEFASSKLMDLQELLNELPPNYQSMLRFPFLKIIYLLALIDQNEGKIQAAKHLYLKILDSHNPSDDHTNNTNSTSATTSNFYSLFYLNINRSSVIQNNQLFIYSNLNLLLIYLRELKNTKDSESMERLTLQRNEVLNNLKMVSIVKEDALLKKTLVLILSLFNNSTEDDSAITNKENISVQDTKQQQSDKDGNKIPEGKAMDILLYDILSKLISKRNQRSIMNKQQKLIECFQNSKLSKNLAIRYFTSLQLCDVFKMLNDSENMNSQFEKTLKLELDLTSLLSAADIFL